MLEGTAETFNHTGMYQKTELCGCDEHMVFNSCQVDPMWRLAPQTKARVWRQSAELASREMDGGYITNLYA